MGEQSVLKRERELQAAVRAHDVDALDDLLHDDLLAVGPDGSPAVSRSGSAAGARRAACAASRGSATAGSPPPTTRRRKRSRPPANRCPGSSRPTARTQPFQNALVTMWTWITEDARDADHMLRDVLAPLLKRDPDT